MGRVRLLKRISTAWHALRGDDPGYADRWYEWSQGSGTKAGVDITERGSLTISTLFAALNFLASTIATLPRVIMRRLPGGGREPAPEHPLYDRLHNQPNDEGLTAWQWIYTSIMHKYLWGNWYSWMFSRSYQNQAIYPLLPERMEGYDKAERRFVYRLESGQKARLPRAEVLHIPHISMDGITGKGVVHYARESLGLAKAQEEFAERFFGQGPKPGGFVQYPENVKPSEETRKGLQEDFNKKYAGLGETWKAIFLTGGAEWKPNELDAAKAQALESRQFSTLEIARWTNLPPHILRDLSRATFSNIEQQSLELVIYSLLPIVTQIEQAMNPWLFDVEERKKFYVKLELKGLLRGDLAARTNFYIAMLDRGVFSADQVLELEDMNPQPAGLGKVYVLPYNMASKERVLRGEEPATGLDIGEEEEEPQEEEGEDERARKRSTQRRLLTKAWKPSFGRALQQLMKREIKAIRGAVKDRGPADFGLWLEEFYRDFPVEAQKTIGRSVGAYSEDLLPVALAEIGSKADVDIPYDAFRQRYLSDLVQRYTEASQRSLSAVLKRVSESGADLTEAIEGQLREWEGKRAARVILYETVRAEGAFSRAAFEAAGVRRLRWKSRDKGNPYCDSLDGKVVGIDEAFVGAGDYQPEGADAPLKISGPRRHPPLRSGCECSIEASE